MLISSFIIQQWPVLNMLPMTQLTSSQKPPADHIFSYIDKSASGRETQASAAVAAPCQHVITASQGEHGKVRLPRECRLIY